MCIDVALLCGVFYDRKSGESGWLSVTDTKDRRFNQPRNACFFVPAENR